MVISEIKGRKQLNKMQNREEYGGCWVVWEQFQMFSCMQSLKEVMGGATEVHVGTWLQVEKTAETESLRILNRLEKEQKPGLLELSK